MLHTAVYSLAGCVVAFACLLLVTVGPVAASPALAATVTFHYDGINGSDGFPQFWVVPSKVHLATFRVYGAQGARGYSCGWSSCAGGPAGGRGGEVTAKLFVKPGELLEINVGGMPRGGSFESGGWNGGGGAYQLGAGAGGGASDVRQSPYGLSDRLLVAGGGGGGGGPGGGAGGAGGGGAGRSGGGAPCSSYVVSGPDGFGFTVAGAGGGGGSGGTQAAGGAGGNCADVSGSDSSGGGTSGSLGRGGAGGAGNSQGAGGGGGFYGGGSGGASDVYSAGGPGGGGGSGFGPAGAVLDTGVRGGNGEVTIAYTPNCGHGGLCVRSVPGAPAHVQATPGNRRATVAFVAPKTSWPTIYKATASPGGAHATAVGAPITISGLKNGTKYTFTVTATNELGTGKRSRSSDAVTPAPPPGPPTNVVAVGGDHMAVVSFTAPKSRWSTVIAYKVTVSRKSSGTAADRGLLTPMAVAPPPNPGFPILVPVRPVIVSPGSTQPVKSPITVRGLTDGVSYTFTVTASNGIGTGPPSKPSNAVTPTGVPDAPTNVTAAAGDGQATVDFVPPYANGSPVKSYTVTVSPGGATFTTSKAPVKITGLTNGTSYTFAVTATNGIGTGPTSNPSNAVTPAGVPAPPTNVTATAGSGQATVSFTAPPNDGSAITSYTVIASPGGKTATGSSASPITVTGLGHGRSYTFTVSATNAVGTGPPSPPSNQITTT